VICGVAADGQAPSVVAVAVSLAETLGSPLIAVHVTPDTIPPGVSAAPWGQARLREAEREDGEHLLDSLLARTSSREGTRRMVTAGRPTETLEQLAVRERARLLVVGSSGKGALASSLRRSVSLRLAGHAPCPVVVVPPGLVALDRPDDDAAAGPVLRRQPAHTR
jgi:nucleotide-binding universal stress UspA family protein